MNSIRFYAASAFARVACLALSFVVVSGLIASAPASAQNGGNAPDRDHQPVLIRGSQAPPLLGEVLDRIRVYSYQDGVGFAPLPYQLDERIVKVFNPGTPLQFTETMYDIEGEDDGLFDENDEIAFLFGDSGELAPASAPWPEGVDPIRLRIEIRDPRANAPVPSRWAYIYTGEGLPTAPVDYVTWDLTANSPVSTSGMEISYEGNWLLSEFRVAAPCGTGEDLIDRVKGRALTAEGIEEDEENWSINSVYIGGMAGPVRAIRYVRGATSGFNTIHHDVIYDRWWRRTVNLRVHPLERVRLYFDLLPIAGTSYFSPVVPDGVAVDGLPDDVPGEFAGWSLVRGPAGGFVTAFDVPPSSLYASREFHYSDDASEDDRISFNPEYGDEDDSAYGAHGAGVVGLGDTNVDAATMIWTVEAQCSNDGDAALGAAHRAIQDQPFEYTVEVQDQGFAPVRTLTVNEDIADLVLDWQEVSGASAYRVYRANDPSLPRESWTLRTETSQSSFVDAGAAGVPSSWYYSVVPLDTAGNEGDW